ncbi:hypothetical protein P7K49_030379 [Saguinus oedipus]|uniref:Transmembrane protein 89 n=1 Tax=Saguinus oedipus TaxID=9490 RepID=A0ABQ9U2W0_SAGOE|nr:hypothetical protein P7K49_030379 [Saguinus oedipus]
MLHVLPSLPLLFLLVMPAPTHAWSRPLWYQVGLDLQPWGCQPNTVEGCRGRLISPGYWLGPGASHIYPVAGITVTTVLLMIRPKMLQWWRRSQATKSEVSTALLSPLQPLPPCTPSEPLSSTQPCPMGPHCGLWASYTPTPGSQPTVPVSTHLYGTHVLYPQPAPCPQLSPLVPLLSSSPCRPCDHHSPQQTLSDTLSA